MLISEIFHHEVITINCEVTVGEAISRMVNQIYNGFVVMDGAGQVVGVLSLQDIAGATVPPEFQHNTSLSMAMYKHGFFNERCMGIKDKKVKELMRTNFIEVTVDMNIMAITADFLKNDLYIVPVFDNKKLVGIITRTEIKKALAKGMGILS